MEDKHQDEQSVDTEQKLNKMVQKIQDLYQHMDHKEKLFSAIEKEKDMKYEKLTEEYKLLAKEKEDACKELQEKRIELWEREGSRDLTYAIKNHIHDNSLLQKALEKESPKRDHSQAKIERVKEERDLIKTQLNDLKNKYKQACQSICVKDTKISEMKTSIQELEHKKSLELKNMEIKNQDLIKELKATQDTMLDLKENLHQLSSMTTQEREENSNHIKSLKDQIDAECIKAMKKERQGDTMEIENTHLASQNEILQKKLSGVQSDLRKSKKEVNKLRKDIDDFRQPTEFDKFLDGKEHTMKSLMEENEAFKKRLIKADSQRKDFEVILEKYSLKLQTRIKADKGEYIDWKKKFKMKKLDGIRKNQRIFELQTQNQELVRDLKAKEKVQKMIESLYDRNGSIRTQDLPKNFTDVTQLIHDLERSKSKCKEFEIIIDEKMEEINTLLKENKTLKNKVLELYHNEKESHEYGSTQIESLINQEAEIKIIKLDAKIKDLEKENKSLSIARTDYQNRYETQVQENNMLNNAVQTAEFELKRFQQLVNALKDSEKESNSRISTLNAQKIQLESKLKEQELIVVRQKQDSSSESIETLKQENELFKKLLNISSNKESTTKVDVPKLQKEVADAKEEINSLNKKIFAYKLMLKESDILLSIFRDQDSSKNLEAINNAIDVEDMKLEELMKKVKLQIEFCVQNVKASLISSSSVPESESANSLMHKQIEELFKEKEDLLEMIKKQETTYKENTERNKKVSDHLKQVLDQKKALESKIISMEKTIQELEAKDKESASLTEKIKSESSLKIYEKDSQIKQASDLIQSLKDEIETTNSSHESEKELLVIEKKDLKTQIISFEEEFRTLKEQLKISAEKFKLKEQEICELKSNYESQIEELVSEKELRDIEAHKEDSIKILPDKGSLFLDALLGKEETDKKALEDSHSFTVKNSILQNKIHNLNQKLFAVKDELIDKEIEIKRFKDEVNDYTMRLGNNSITLENLEEKSKVDTEEIAKLTKERDQLQVELAKIKEDLEVRIKEYKSQIEGATKKIQILKSQIEAKTGGQTGIDKLGSPELKKIVVRMLEILRKSKKIHEIREEEITKLKNELEDSLKS
ncbi:unnamed protein product [Moneuplotes crassus]|uniref:Uncharacterized protein n=1 Tax=Euplotes crassus TaxID=5936 RepID=A0AAD1XE69_EUPCR|nr:unnamed protein product [Moneuplotes crassus]